MQQIGSLLLATAVLIGCAQTRRPGSTDQLWGGGHPEEITYLSVHNGTTKYRTTGTGADKDTRADAEWYRLVFASWGGLEFNWSETADTLDAGAKLQSLDVFTFAQIPYVIDQKSRGNAKVGAFYNEWNVSGGSPTDVDPYTVGPRADFEYEYDAVRTDNLAFTLFGSGRADYGWGRASTGVGSESTTAFGWGYELGLRLHGGSIFGQISWVDRTQNVKGGNNFSKADYGFEGVGVSFGARW